EGSIVLANEGRALLAVLDPLDAAGGAKLAVVEVASRRGERLHVDVQVQIGPDREACADLRRDRRSVDVGEDVSVAERLLATSRQRGHVLLRVARPLIRRLSRELPPRRRPE